MTKGGKEYKFPFIGLPSHIYMKLAMIGAGAILCKHDKPLVQWEKINQNLFGRERNYARVSKIVHALAAVENIKIEQAIKKYKEMPAKEKRELKASKEIRKQLLMMQLSEFDE